MRNTEGKRFLRQQGLLLNTKPAEKAEPHGKDLSAMYEELKIVNAATIGEGRVNMKGKSLQCSSTHHQ